MVTISPALPGTAAVDGLVTALVAELTDRYGEEDDPGEVHPEAVYLLASTAGEPVGCCAVAPLAPGVCELKRMYVSPAARGLGVSRLLLTAAEEHARALGAAELRLETGVRQPEAIGLYKASGFARIANYGHYATSTLSLCFTKRLA
jgi:putative acetyltransferase